MSELTKQIEEGLKAKIGGIKTAMMYVKDARELERLSADLVGAEKALKKLHEPDSRSADEVAEIDKMLSDTADVDVPKIAWSDMTPLEKFEYQVQLYVDKLGKTLKEAKEQRQTLGKVITHMKKSKGDSDVFMNPVIRQFEDSYAQVSFSIEQISKQLELFDDVKEIILGGDFFEKLSKVNRFMNNPMSLPHLTEEREKELEALRNNGTFKNA